MWFGEAEKHARLLHAPAGRRQRHVPLLRHAVAGVRHLLRQHGVVLPAIAVDGVAPAREQDLPLEVPPVEPGVVDGDLGGRTGIQRVEQLGIAEKHRGLVVLGRNGVVDVRKAQRFGVFAPKLENPVRPDAPDGDRLLYGARNGNALAVLPEDGLQRSNHASAPPLPTNAP